LSPMKYYTYKYDFFQAGGPAFLSRRSV
jgi:hypothetical protein